MRPAVRLSALMGLETPLGLDARLGRRRRGRPDAPAGRAPHGAARDPEPLVRAARRRERDRDGLADRARADGRAGRAGADPAEAADARPHRGRRGRRCAARRLRALAERGRGARRDRDRDRLGALDRARGGAVARDGAVVRVVSMPCWELFDEQDDEYRDDGAAARRRARGSRSRPASRTAGSGGSRARPRSASTASAPRRRPSAIFEELGITAAAQSPRRSRRCSPGEGRVAAFDHRGVKLRDAVLGAIAAGGDAGRSRRRHRRRSRRLSRPGARRRRGDPARRGRARRARLRLRRRRLGRGVQDRRHPRRDLPRHLFRPSGRRARRHERPLPRLRGRRRRRSPASSCARFSAPRSSARGAICERLEEGAEHRKEDSHGPVTAA